MAKNRRSSQNGDSKGMRRGHRGLRVFLVFLETILVIVLAVGCYAVNLFGTMEREDISNENIYVYNGQSQSIASVAPVTTETENLTSGIEDITQASVQTTEAVQATTAPEQTQDPDDVWTVKTETVETEEEYEDFLSHQATVNGYWNILLLGVDARMDQPMSSGEYRADVIIICSINVSTKVVKLASIYRDTIVKMYSYDKYIKVNDGVFQYLGGSPTEMLSIINLNFDMNIQDIVIVNWAALALIVNDLGGLILNITQEEIDSGVITGYLTEVVNETGIATSGQFVSGGEQACDGAKVVAYCRNRYTTGSDFNRTNRQREVIEKLLEKAKVCGLGSLIKAIRDVFSNMYTTLSMEELFELAADVGSYTIGDTCGFPITNQAVSYAGRLYSDYQLKDVVVATTLSTNVAALHSFLFGEDGYSPSSQVNTISYNIGVLSGIQ